MKNNIEIKEIAHDNLEEYFKVPSKYYADKKLELNLINGGIDGALFKEKPIEQPYWVDNDSYNGSSIVLWSKRWDIKNWYIIGAYIDGLIIGAAALAHDTEGVNRLSGRADISVLWDIRIHPDYKHRGIGTQLIQRVIEISKEKNCKYMKIESQNTNVTACRFYRKNGGVLGSYMVDAYTDEPGAIMMDWYIYL